MGVPIRTEHLYTFSFADDQVIISLEEEGLGYMVQNLEEQYKKDGLATNINHISNNSIRNHKKFGNRKQTNDQRNGQILIPGIYYIRKESSKEEIKNRIGQN